MGKVYSSDCPLSPGRIQSPEAFSGAKYHNPVPRCQPQPRLGDSWVHALPLLEDLSNCISQMSTWQWEDVFRRWEVVSSLSPASAFHPRQHHGEDLESKQRGDWKLQLPIPTQLCSSSLAPAILPPPHPVTGAESLGRRSENQWRALQTGKHEYWNKKLVSKSARGRRRKAEQCAWEAI